MPNIGYFLLFLLQTGSGFSETTYLNANAWDAQRITAGIISVEPKFLPTKEEKVEWAKARLAAISLARLQAKEDEALKLFEECGETCEKYGDSAEWNAVKAWGCQKKRDTDMCLSKTKAQKPPH
ncbi:MAG: hypothetical protein ACXWQO_03705 [Bdellovibrionota bacterium]